MNLWMILKITCNVLLLDTHTLIWFLNGDEKLSEKAKISIEDMLLSLPSIKRYQFRTPPATKNIGQYAFSTILSMQS